MAKYPIEVLNLSVRASNILHSMDVHTVEALLDVPVEKFVDQRNLGAKTLAEIKNIIHKLTVGEIDLNNIVYDSNNDTEDYSLIVIPDDVLYELSLHNIEELQLSTRANNILLSGGFSKISDIVNLSKVKFTKLQGLGDKSRKEILKKTKEWLNENGYLFANSGSEEYLNEEERHYYIELATLLKPLCQIYWRKLYHYIKESNLKEEILRGGYHYVSAENLEAVLKLPEIQEIIQEWVLSISYNNEGFIDEQELISILSKNGLEFDACILLDVIRNGEICYRLDDYYFIKRMNILEYIGEMMKNQGANRQFDILLKRLEGKGLQEIGDELGLTRERIRQVCRKQAGKVSKLKEDYLQRPFCYFKFTKEEYVKIFVDSSPEGFEYLSLKYKKGTLVLNRENLANYRGPYTNQLQQFLDESEKLIDKKTVTKMQMVYRVLISTGIIFTSIEQFMKSYYQHIDDNGYPYNRLTLNTRTLINMLRNANGI